MQTGAVPEFSGFFRGVHSGWGVCRDGIDSMTGVVPRRRSFPLWPQQCILHAACMLILSDGRHYMCFALISWFPPGFCGWLVFRLHFFTAVFAALLAVCVGCVREQQPAVPASQTAAPAPVLFQELPLPLLAAYPHRSPEDSFEMPGIMGSGCALADLNADGLSDILLVPGDAPESAAVTAADQDSLLPVFLQQADGSFIDATGQARLQVRGFGMGCYPADIDNDGDLDVLTTSAAGTALFRCEDAQKLSFSDITESAGLVSSRWSSAAACVDYDCDGWLDIFVVNYVDYFPGSHCADASGRRDYCGPHAFSGTADLLYRNLGSAGQPGVFENVTAAAGLAAAVGKGLGTVCTDLNGDRLVDFYVANDMEPNRLWIQGPPGHFTDEASLRGCAVDLQGRPQASMGTILADLDHDGLEDLFLTHLRGETNTWYRQLGQGVFLDDTVRSGLAEASRNETGFGVIAGDLNLDGEVDLAVVNGRVMRAPLLQASPADSHWKEYAEPRRIFLAKGAGEFEVLSGSDAFAAVAEVSRGLAMGDIDNDGDLDLLTTAVSAPARVFQNTVSRRGRWLSLRVRDPRRMRDAIGARVVIRAGARRWTASLLPHTGYLSTQDSRLHFGLGATESVDAVDVYWPEEQSGAERFRVPTVDCEVELLRGQGVRMTDEQLAGENQ